MAGKVVKAGWLHRQSTILQRWKTSWVVLYSDGVIKHYATPNDHEAEEAKLTRNVTAIKTALQVSNNAASLPPGCVVGCLFELVFSDAQWLFCGQTLDEASAWVSTLAHARGARLDQPPAYVANPPTVVYPQQNTVYAPAQVQATSVIYPGRAAVYPGQTTVVCPPQTTSVVYPRQTTSVVYPQQTTSVVYPQQTSSVVYQQQPYVTQPGQTTVVYANQPRYRRRGYSTLGVVAGAVAVGSLFR